MEIVYDESTGTWSEREEPYTTLDVQTEEDWNKLEFMINNFSKLEEENKELKRLLRLALNDFEFIYDEHSCTGARKCDTFCPYNGGEEDCCKGKWKHAEEALKLIGDDKQ